MCPKRLVLSGVVGSLLTVLGSVASATPPSGGGRAPVVRGEGDDARVVGRVRIRGQVIDLTLQSLATGGEANELAPAYALPVHADIDDSLIKRSTER